MDEAPREIQVSAANEHRHEESDARIRPLAMFLAGLAGSLVIVVGLVWLFFDVLFATINATPIERPTANWSAEPSQEPQLQISPRGDVKLLRAYEDKRLHATEWIDRDHGRVRIPIETAMEMVASNGLPKWPPAVPTMGNAEASQPQRGGQTQNANNSNK